MLGACHWDSHLWVEAEQILDLKDLVWIWFGYLPFEVVNGDSKNGIQIWCKQL